VFVDSIAVVVVADEPGNAIHGAKCASVASLVKYWPLHFSASVSGVANKTSSLFASSCDAIAAATLTRLLFCCSKGCGGLYERPFRLAFLCTLHSLSKGRRRGLQREYVDHHHPSFSFCYWIGVGVSSHPKSNVFGFGDPC